MLHAQHLGKIVLAGGLVVAGVSAARAQCPPRPPIQNHDAAGTNPCLCLIQGDEVGATFAPPAADYPLEVLSVGVFWKSQLGGAPASFEQGIHVYNAGLPNPGGRIYTELGPIALLDGVMNTIAFTSPVPVASGPITVTLEIVNQSSGGNAMTASVVDDQNGCLGQNVVFTAGSWLDPCTQGLQGDWVMEMTYRPCTSTVGAEPGTWGLLKSRYAEP